jgi:hypothetical protein
MEDEKLYKISYVNKKGHLQERIGKHIQVGKVEFSWFDIKLVKRIFINNSKLHGREEYVPVEKEVKKDAR